MRPWLRYLPLVCDLAGLACLLAGLAGWLTQPRTELIRILDVSDSQRFVTPDHPFRRYEAILQPQRTVSLLCAGATVMLADTATTSTDDRQPQDSVALQPSRTDLEQALAAAAAIPADGYVRRRVLLCTDGRENAGHAAEAARRYAARFRLDVIPSGVVPTPDARVEWLALPGAATAGQTIAATAFLSSATEVAATAEFLSPTGERLQSQVLQLSPAGIQTEFSFAATGDGVQEYALRVRLTGDKVPQNDTARAAVLVRGNGTVLWTGDTPPPVGWLPEGLQLRRISPGQLDSSALYPSTPTNPENASRLPAAANRDEQTEPVVLLALDNLSAADLSGRERLLEEYLQRGGRLLVLGGDRSLAAGGWAGGALEKILPAEVIPADRLEVIFALDVSGSMGEDAGGRSKLALAQGALLAAIGGLGSHDEAGLIAFSREGRTLLPLRKTADSDWAAALRETGADGGTSLFAGIRAARASFPRNDTGSRRHIIVITDGDTLEKGDIRKRMVEEARETLRRDKTGLSIIAVGARPEEPLLRELTEGLGSVTLAGEQLAELPQLLRRNLDTARDGYFRNKLTVRSHTGDWPLQRTEAFGPLRGRPGDAFLLQAQNGEGLAAAGRYGLGQVLLLGGSPWRDWADSAPARDFFHSALRSLLTGSATTGRLRVWCAGGKVQVLWQPEDPAGGGYAAELLDPLGNPAGFLPLRPERGGSWSATLPAPADGAYTIDLWTGRLAADSTAGRLLERCALRVENREEYLRYGADGAALEHLALAGGGALVFAPERLADWNTVPVSGEGGRFPLPLALAALAFLAAGLFVRGWRHS